MAGPWEQYAKPAQDGPWSKYAAPDSATPPTDQIPGGGVSGSRKFGKQPERSMMDRAKGVGEAALTMGTGTFGAAAGGASALADLAFGSQSMQGADKKFGEVAAANTYAPRTEAGKDYVGAIGEAFDKSKIPVTPLTGEFTNALKTGAMAKPAIASAAAKVPMALKADPEVLKLAQKARAFGIQLRPDMLTDNKFARIFGQAMEQVPASGSKEQERLVAFNRSLVSQIGGDTTSGRMTPEVFNKSLQKSGIEIGNFYKKSKIDSDTLNKSLTAVESNIGAETADAKSIMSFYLEQARGLNKDGQINPIAMRKLDSKIGARIRSATDGDLREGLGSIQDALRDSVNAGLSEADRGLLNESRTRYAKAITLEPLVAKAKRGYINPSLLLGQMNSSRQGKSRMARGKAGDMGDLARIGSEFLTNPGSSNTAERGAIYGGLGAAGAGAAYVNPLAAGGIYGMANLYNRLGPMLIPKK